MLYIRPGTHALTLLQLLSVAGEFPARTFHIGQSAYLAGTSPQAGGSAYDRGQLERQAVLRPIAVHKRETRPYAEYPVA